MTNNYTATVTTLPFFFLVRPDLGNRSRNANLALNAKIETIAIGEEVFAQAVMVGGCPSYQVEESWK